MSGEAVVATRRRAHELAHRGERARLQGDLAGALTLFDEALALCPEYPWALAHRGATYRLLGAEHYRAAMDDFNRALSLKPDYVWAIAFRARLHELFRDYAAALEDFDRAIARDEHIIGHWRAERAMLLGFLGRFEEAVAQSDEALAVEPRDHFAAYARAVHLYLWRGPDAAAEAVAAVRAMLRPLAAGGPEQGIALYRLAGLDALQGRRASALHLFTQAKPLEAEAILFARHDLAWLDFRHESAFQEMVRDVTGDLTIG